MFLTDNSGLEVNKHGAGHMLSSSSLAEEGIEGVVASADGLVRGHLAVWLNAVLQAIELPAGVANLDASLPNVDRDALTLWRRKRQKQYAHCSCILNIFTIFQVSFRRKWVERNSRRC